MSSRRARGCPHRLTLAECAHVLAPPRASRAGRCPDRRGPRCGDPVRGVGDRAPGGPRGAPRDRAADRCGAGRAGSAHAHGAPDAHARRRLRHGGRVRDARDAGAHRRAALVPARARRRRGTARRAARPHRGRAPRRARGGGGVADPLSRARRRPVAPVRGHEPPPPRAPRDAGAPREHQRPPARRRQGSGVGAAHGHGERPDPPRVRAGSGDGARGPRVVRRRPRPAGRTPPALRPPGATRSRCTTGPVRACGGRRRRATRPPARAPRRPRRVAGP